MVLAPLHTQWIQLAIGFFFGALVGDNNGIDPLDFVP